MTPRAIMPTVSIITPTYNRAALVGRTVRSVLAQSYRDFEYLILDDGSTDDTRSVIAAFNDPRICYQRFDTNETHAVRYKNAFLQCRGRYVMRLDSDDYFIHDRCLETMVGRLEAAPASEIVHAYVWIDEQSGREVTGFRGWVDGRLPITFEDLLMMSKGYSDVLWISRRRFIDNLLTYYKEPFNWFTGFWEALQPDFTMMLFKEPMGVAGWGGDNISTFDGGQKTWRFNESLHRYFAQHYFHLLRRNPPRLSEYLQWTAYYQVLLGQRFEAARHAVRSLRYNTANWRSWALLALAPLPSGATRAILRRRQRAVWVDRNRGSAE